MSIEKQRDALYRQIAGSCKSMPDVLDSFFGFLKRNTDFYVVDDSSDSAMGFPTGVAENLVLSAFRKHALVKAPKQGNDMSHRSSGEISSPTADQQQRESQPKQKASPSAMSLLDQFRANVKLSKRATSSSKSMQAEKAHSGPSSQLQVPMGNGGVTERYWWNQTLHHVVINIPLERGTRGSDIAVRVDAGSLKVSTKTTEAPILVGNLDANVRSSEVVWTLDKELALLTIELDKVDESWWKCCLKGDACIDTTLVDSTQVRGRSLCKHSAV